MAPLRLEKLRVSSSGSLRSAVVQRRPEIISQLRVLELHMGKSWDPNPVGTPSMFDACAASLQCLAVAWWDGAGGRWLDLKPLRTDRPLAELRSLELTFPFVTLNHPRSVLEQQDDPTYPTASAILELLIQTLQALRGSSKLRELTISASTRILDDTTPPEDVAWQNLFLKPIQPEVRRLWMAIDDALARCVALQVLTLNTTAEFEVQGQSRPPGENAYGSTLEYPHAHIPRSRPGPDELFAPASALLPKTTQLTRVVHNRRVDYCGLGS